MWWKGIELLRPWCLIDRVPVGLVTSFNFSLQYFHKHKVAELLKRAQESGF